MRLPFLKLVLSIVLTLGTGEVVARALGARFLSLGHRVAFKLELLKAKAPVDFVVLGSSRGNDCVEPGPIGANGFSLATPSSSLGTIEYLAQESAALPGLKFVWVELSRRQLAEAELDVEAGIPDVDGKEDPLGAWIGSHSAFIRGRRALAVDNWSRIPALVFPSRFDGSEFFHTKWLGESLVSVPPANADELAKVNPEKEAPLSPQSGSEWDRVSAGYRRVVDYYRAYRIQVLFYGPPLAPHRQAQECDAASKSFRFTLAQQAGAPLYDFACASVPLEWLTDRDEHCGAVGRRRFSEKLAEISKGAHGLP